MRRMLKDTLGYVPSTVLPILFATVGVVVYTRIFTTAEYGVYNFALSVVIPATLLMTEWAAQPIGRYYADYDAAGRLEAYRRGVAALILWIVGAVLLLSFAVGCLVILDIPSRLALYAGIVAAVLTQCVFVLTSRILPSSLRPDRYRRAIVWSSGLSVGFSLLLLALFGKHVAWLFWGQACGNLVLIPALLRWSRLPLGPAVLRITPEIWALARRFWAYGAPMMIWFLSGSILDDEDRYVLQWFHGSAQVGVYSVNYNLISAVGNLLNTPVVIAVGPLLYRQWSMRRYGEAADTMAGMTEMYAMLAAAVLGGTMVAGTSVVHIFLGRPFWDGAGILVPVLAGRLLWGAASIGHRSLELCERTSAMAVSGLAAAALNLLLNLLFVPRYGYAAAACSTALSYAAYAGIIKWQSRRHVKWKIHAGYVVRYILLGIACAAPVRWWVLPALAPSSPLAQLSIGLSLYLALYGGLFAIFFKRRIGVLLLLHA
jgi:O-antigen/teichoic acid export membrane protein